jgi:hypothetical protein
MLPHTAKELVKLEATARGYADVKGGDIYRGFMLFRYCANHVSVLCDKKYDLGEEEDEEGDTLIKWQRTKKQGAAARTSILKHKNIDFDVSEWAKALYRRKRRNNRVYWYRKMQELGAAAGVANVSPNSLRHSLAVQLLNEGYHESTVAQLLNCDRKTLKWYARFTDKGLKNKLKESGW